MARAFVKVILTFQNQQPREYTNLEHKDVDHNVTPAELKAVYTEKLRQASREAAKDGVGFLDLGDDLIPITLNDFPALSLEITTLSKE